MILDFKGYLAKIITAEGGVQAVGSPVAILVSTKDEISSVTSGTEPTTAPVSPTVSTPSEFFGTTVDMPALSSTMKEGKIVMWNKNIGDKVELGDVLLVVESDKADMDVEAFEEGKRFTLHLLEMSLILLLCQCTGYLAKIIVPEGGVGVVGSPIAVIVTDQNDISKVSVSPTGSQSQSVAVAPSPATGTVSAVVTTPTPTSTAQGSKTMNQGDRVIASGWAKQVAAEKGIDLRSVVSSRPDGNLHTYLPYMKLHEKAHIIYTSITLSLLSSHRSYH